MASNQEGKESSNFTDSFDQLESDVDVPPIQDEGLTSSIYFQSDNKGMLKSEHTKTSLSTPFQVYQEPDQLQNQREYEQIKERYEKSTLEFKEVTLAVDELINFFKDLGSIYKQSNDKILAAVSTQYKQVKVIMTGVTVNPEAYL